MQIDPTLFDSDRLYTTEWVAPHHDHLNFGTPPAKWDATKAGILLGLEMSERGLTIYDITIKTSGTRLLVSGPRGLSETPFVSLSMKRPSAATRMELRALLDLVCANLARERMMRAVGWTRGAPEPVWAQLTTPLTEHVLGLSGYCSYDLWSLPEHCSDPYGRIDPPDHMTGDAREALPLGFQALRVGPILRLEGSFGAGVRFAQGARTCIVMPQAGLRASELSRKKRPTVQDYGSVGTGQIALYLNRRTVSGVYHHSLVVTNSRMLQIEMPIITMDEIPEAALRAVGMQVPREHRRYPFWSIITRVAPAEWARRGATP